MDKKIITAVAVVLITIMAFTACKGAKNIISSDETTETDISHRADINPPVPTSDVQVHETTKPDIKEEKTTAAPVTEENTTKKEPVVSGEQDMGLTPDGKHKITQKDGVTYIDGVLVANKTYGLPRSYNPGGLTPECQKAFSEMQADAKKEGYSLWNGSGFRSYGTQESIYNRYVARDGQAEADRYSARPGHSEHQTGLAIDLNDISSSFADTAAGKWVDANCWKYGFIIRYKKETEAQTGYMYEPWHIRYVGKDMAEKIYKSGKCLEDYFGITSEYQD